MLKYVLKRIGQTVLTAFLATAIAVFENGTQSTPER